MLKEKPDVSLSSFYRRCLYLQAPFLSYRYAMIINGHGSKIITCVLLIAGCDGQGLDGAGRVWGGGGNRQHRLKSHRADCSGESALLTKGTHKPYIDKVFSKLEGPLWTQRTVLILTLEALYTSALWPQAQIPKLVAWVIIDHYHWHLHHHSALVPSLAQVVGSEGSGLRTNVRRACTGLVQVRMGMGLGRPNTDAGTQQGGGRAVAVDSLNVAVATAVLLHDLLRSARGRVGKP